MDNRIEKIRAEVDRLHSKWMLISTTEGYYKCKLCNQLLKFIDSLQEEPVSEDLEDAADKYSQSIHSDYSNDMFDSHNIYDAVIYGSNWQKQQMMKDATEVTVHIDAGNYPYIPEIELYDYDNDVPLAKEGDKYKVVLIKEE